MSSYGTLAAQALILGTSLSLTTRMTSPASEASARAVTSAATVATVAVELLLPTPSPFLLLVLRLLPS